MPIRFHISHQLSNNNREIIRHGLTRGLKDSQRQGFGLQDADIEVAIDPKRDLMECGVGGGVEGARRIKLFIEPTKVGDAQFPGALAQVTTHELDHIDRGERGLNVRTLGDAIVSEGFAQVAERAAGHTPFPHSLFPNRAQMDAFAQKVLQHVNDALLIGMKDSTGKSVSKFSLWFFNGGGDSQMPREAGYALGNAVVGGYLAANHLSLADSRHIQSSTIIDAWKAGEFALDIDPPAVASRKTNQSTGPEFSDGLSLPVRPSPIVQSQKLAP